MELKPEKLLNKLGINKSRSLNDTIYTFIVSGTGIVFGVLISIFLGRTLGPKGLGIISLTNQIVGILLMLIMLGIPTVIIKEVAIAFSRKDWEHANSVISTSLKINGTWGIIIILLAYALIPYAVSHIFNEPLLKVPLTIAVFAMFFQIISRIFSAGMNGYRKIWQSSLVKNTLSLFIAGIVLLFQYLAGYRITVVMVAWDYAISRAFVAVVITIYWKVIQYPSNHKKFIPKPILKVALPLLFAQATNIIANSADIIMIGWLLTAKDVGLYSVAIRIAYVSGIFLQVINSVTAPKIAALYANNNVKEMEKMAQKVTKLISLIAILVFMGILLFGKIVLSIWGDEFITAYNVLVILSIGQVIKLITEQAGMILTMCNQEKVLGLLTFISAISNIILNYFFIQYWGITGAAISTTSVVILMNITEVYVVKKRIDIQIIPFRLTKAS